MYKINIHDYINNFVISINIVCGRYKNLFEDIRIYTTYISNLPIVINVSYVIFETFTRNAEFDGI